MKAYNERFRPNYIIFNITAVPLMSLAFSIMSALLSVLMFMSGWKSIGAILLLLSPALMIFAIKKYRYTKKERTFSMVRAGANDIKKRPLEL